MQPSRLRITLAPCLHRAAKVEEAEAAVEVVTDKSGSPPLRISAAAAEAIASLARTDQPGKSTEVLSDDHPCASEKAH